MVRPLIVSMAVLASASFVSARPNPPLQASEDPSVAAEPTESISISGEVEGLYPGQPARLRLRLYNRTTRRLVVTSIEAEAGDANPTCADENLQVEPRTLERGIPPRSNRRAGITVSLVADAEDGCQGAKFPLQYRSRATR